MALAAGIYKKYPFFLPPLGRENTYNTKDPFLRSGKSLQSPLRPDQDGSFLPSYSFCYLPRSFHISISRSLALSLSLFPSLSLRHIYLSIYFSFSLARSLSLFLSIFSGKRYSVYKLDPFLPFPHILSLFVLHECTRNI